MMFFLLAVLKQLMLIVYTVLLTKTLRLQTQLGISPEVCGIAEWVECWSRPANFPYPTPDC